MWRKAAQIWEQYLRASKLLLSDIEYCISRTNHKKYRTGGRETRKIVKVFLAIWQTEEPQGRKFGKFLNIITDDFNRQSAEFQLDATKLKKTWQSLERANSEDSEESDAEL